MFGKITIDTSQLNIKLRTISKFMDEIGLPAAGVIAITEIKETTAAGIDPKGSVYPGYSDPYKKLKAKIVGSASPVNLRLSEDMINSLAYFPLSINHGEVNVGAAEYLKAVGNSETRQFLIKSDMMIEKIRVDEIKKLQAYLQ